MNDASKSRRPQDQQFDVLEAQVRRQTHETLMARFEARRARAIAELHREMLLLSRQGLQRQEISVRFLELVVGVVPAEHAFIATRNEERPDVLVVEHSLGCPGIDDLLFVPENLGTLHMRSSQAQDDPVAEQLAEVCKVANMSWVLDRASGIGLFLGSNVEDQGRPPFTSEDGPDLEAILTSYVYTLERRKTEESRWGTELRFRDVIDNGPFGVLEVELSGEITYANRASEKILRRKGGEIVGRTLQALLDGNPLDAIFTQDPESDDLAASTIACRVEAPDHDLVDLEVTWHARRDDDDNVAGLIIWLEDVTAKNQAEYQKTLLSDTFTGILAHMPTLFFRVDPDGMLKGLRGSGISRLGISTGRTIGQRALEMLPGLARHLPDAFAGQTVYCELKGGTNKTQYAFLCHLSPDPEQDRGVIGFAIDVTTRILAEERLRKLSLAVEQSPATVMITDRNGVIEYVNHMFTEKTGYTAGEVIGRNPRLLKSGHTPQEEYKVLWRRISAGETWRGEFLTRKKNGALFWEEATISPVFAANGEITHFLAVKEDVSVRKEQQRTIEWQTNFDGLTGLPNRLLAFDRLSQSIAAANRSGHSVGLLFIDLDDFKKINDTLGHSTGDAVIQRIAARLVTIARASDTVARLGGDEFLLILPDMNEAADSEVVAKKVLERLAEPMLVDGQEIYGTASIGMTIYPDDAEDPRDLWRNADAAMHRSKARGRNTYEYFRREMNEAALKRWKFEARLRYAIEENHLNVHYQPVIDLATGRLVGAEALVRWTDPELGSVPPSRFIPLAEDTGLIIPIGEWVLRRTCESLKRWLNQYSGYLHIAVNVSSRQFRQRGFPEMVRSVLEEVGLPTDTIELEITESVLMDDEGESLEVLQRLKASGVRLAIDDFGTGYSSLGYLKRYPFHTLKIDRSFLRDVASDPGDRALVNAILVMAHSLGMDVIGEGVETEDQLEFLRAHACERAQGYFLSRPVAEAEFEALLCSKRSFF